MAVILLVFAGVSATYSIHHHHHYGPTSEMNTPFTCQYIGKHYDAARAPIGGDIERTRCYVELVGVTPPQRWGDMTVQNGELHCQTFRITQTGDMFFHSEVFWDATNEDVDAWYWDKYSTNPTDCFVQEGPEGE